MGYLWVHANGVNGRIGCRNSGVGIDLERVLSALFLLLRCTGGGLWVG